MKQQSLELLEKEEKPRLPLGWRWMRLGEVCDFQGGTQPPKANFMPEPLPGYVRLLQIQDFKTDEYAIYVPDDLKLNKCDETDVLVGRYGASVGRILRGKAGAYNVAIVKTLPNLSFISKDFLFYLLTGNGFQTLIRDVSARAAQAGFNKNDVGKLKIPLPPLPEQQRISSLLNEQMTMVERARAAAQIQLEAAKSLPAAYLRAAFNSPEAQTWPTVKIGEIARVQSGYAFKSDWFAVDGIRLLRNANVSQGFIRWDDSVFLPTDRRHEFKDYEINEGDIVLSLDRPLVGKGLKVARISKEDLPALLLQRVGRFHLSDSIVPNYLYSYINSERFIDAITKHDQSLGVPHISPKQVESIEMPLPSLSKQKSIVSIIKSHISEVGRLSMSIELQLSTVNALPAALLRRAFNGEL
ncbi:MAG: restriction endonuclease subunit S [Desulfobaccales bacterium]